MLMICESCGYEADSDDLLHDECPICGSYMDYENEFEDGFEGFDDDDSPNPWEYTDDDYWDDDEDSLW